MSGPRSEPRRIVVLAEGDFGFHNAKTAMGVIRYGPDPVVAVIDSTRAGRSVSEWLGDDERFDIPIVGSLDEALALGESNALLIGIAPTGGRLPDAWRTTILSAIERGLSVLSGLHTFIGDDPQLASAAQRAGVSIIDYRRPPARMETSVGRPHLPGKRVILTVGTDCAIGKMSVALELRRSALAAGRSAVFPPGGGWRSPAWDSPSRSSGRWTSWGSGRQCRPVSPITIPTRYPTWRACAGTCGSRGWPGS